MEMPPIVLDRVMTQAELEALCVEADCNYDCDNCALNDRMNNRKYLEETQHAYRD